MFNSSKTKIIKQLEQSLFMESNLILKPNKTAFVHFTFLKSFFVTTLIFLIVTIFLITNNLIFFWIIISILLIIFLSYTYLNLNAAYNKTSYNFYDSKIIVNTGTLFSNSSVELVVKNIVQVTMIKPFIAHKLFKVGLIQIKLAGSAGVEGLLYYIDSPDTAFANIEKTMQKNGFNLKKTNLIQKEKPAVIGVLMNMIGTSFGGFFVLWIISPTVIFFYSINSFITIIVILLILIFAIIGFYINYMNLIKRKYFIYNDTIIFFEGFLTKVYSFIPNENLANSEITQSLLEKIFDIHDIKISCQGASHKIIFKNLKNGVEMERNIDKLIKNSTPLIGKNIEKKEVDEEVIAMKLKPTISEKTFFDNQFTFETKMDFLRSIVGILFFGIIALLFFLVIGIIFGDIFTIINGFFWVIIAGFFGSIGILIQIAFTKYQILEKGISEKFNFLNKRNIEFSNEKITGIIFKKNFIDSFFNTFSIVFWSIGSGTDINFKNIKKNGDLKEKILSKIGVNKEEEVYTINSVFSLMDFLKANIFFAIILFVWIFTGLILSIFIDFLFVLIPIITLILLGAITFYKKWFYSTSKLIFTKNYLYFKAGIFFINEYYALYNNVKDITTIKYPLTNTGLITFNVAGVSIIQNQNKKTSLFSSNDDSSIGETSFGIPHTISINYSKEIEDKDELIDIILYKKLNKNEIINFKTNKNNFAKTILTAKPSIKNTLFVTGLVLGFFTIIISFFAFLLNPILTIIPIILFLLIIALNIWRIKVISYKIQNYRIIAKSGIFYKKQTSIIFNKIDHLTNHQGLVNKIFKNGDIFVFTTGSSSVEMFVKNIPNFNDFYKKLEDFYQ